MPEIDELTIGNEENLRISFHSPKVDSTGWLKSYTITISGNGIIASLAVENPPYGLSTSCFFEKLAHYWQCWKPEYDWGALDGEFDLSANADSLGHITITARLYSGGWNLKWKAEVSIALEAGQLDSIAYMAKSFFEPARSNTS